MTKKISDVIYGEIIFSDKDIWLYELISCREFKRLINIFQLGEYLKISNINEHNRFKHSCGVYHITKLFLDHLKSTNDYERKVILAAAILHDIGHGPKSHSFEVYTNHNHEKMSVQIICSKNTEINKILLKNNIDPIDVSNILLKKSKIKWHNTIISSQLDADRLDYLMRDNFYLEKKNKKIIDYKKIISSSRIFNNNLCFDRNVIKVIESVILLRKKMFDNFYLKNNVVVYEVLLEKIFARIKFLHKEGYKFIDKIKLFYLLYPWLNNGEFDIETFIKLDDTLFDKIVDSLKYETDDILKMLVSSYRDQLKFECISSIKGIKPLNNKTFNYKKIINNKTVYSRKDKIFIYDNNKIQNISKYSQIIRELKKNKYKKEIFFIPTTNTI